MTDSPSESNALRREWIGGFLGFVVGLVAFLAGAAWLLNHVFPPNAGWWEMLHVAIILLLWSGILALALGGAVMLLLSKLHYRMGFYPCPFCSRPLKSDSIACECLHLPPVAAKLELFDPLTWCWRNLRWVILAYLCVIPIAAAVMFFGPAKHQYPFWIQLAVLHFVICALVAALLEFLVTIGEWLGRGKLAAERIQRFLTPFILWPAAGGILLLIFTLTTKGV